jgi:hypothetical protein
LYFSIMTSVQFMQFWFFSSMFGGERNGYTITFRENYSAQIHIESDD